MVETSKGRLLTEETQDLSSKNQRIDSDGPSNPLPASFYVNLLQLEDIYQKHDYTVDLLNDMISHYAVFFKKIKYIIDDKICFFIFFPF